MADSPKPDTRHLEALTRAIEQTNKIVIGKTREVRLAYTALLAGGHLLIEDLPGVGKTTLAHALAANLGLSFQRVQFTSDLLPSDILGVSIYDRERGGFSFHPGPVFAQLMLGDEINRATPKTQSALLEAMAEGQVTVDGISHPLPQPFFVVATQNPVDLAGTFPLPDSQLDRFLLRIGLGYPDRQSEHLMLIQPDRRRILSALQPCLDAERICALQEAVMTVTTSNALVNYVQDLIDASRRHPQIRIGLSPRAGLALLAAARAWALIGGRAFVLPEDVQAVFVSVTAHRLTPASDTSVDRDSLARLLLDDVAVD